jgi:pyridinium-3,5-biscarboxylic acid mononucleotide sulfurtransferase
VQDTPRHTIPTTFDSKPNPPEPPDVAKGKELELRSLMRSMRNVLVAYSGGVDSTYLAYVANDELGERALCVLGLSPSVSKFQTEQAANLAREFGLNFDTLTTKEIENEHYSSNPTNRCYFCKSELYEKLSAIARLHRIDFVLDGTNADDLLDVRPGREAAKENSVCSPLADVGLTKKEIRELSRRAGLSCWEKPSSPCLASRIAYGVPVTIERLSKVESAEDALREMGFREFRVRVHGDLARIEISPGELDKALNKEFADAAVERLGAIGFKYVTLDLRGFRSGSMN